jgi:hypothetical protein
MKTKALKKEEAPKKARKPATKPEAAPLVPVPEPEEAQELIDRRKLRESK